MVFESVVTDVLNKVLGDYVENLDKNQLKIGIWGGDVVLNNLKLRENALDDLDLPVQLAYGYLGKLVLKIPWKNLYKQAVVAQVEDLYVIVCPKQSVPYDPEKEAKYELEIKQAALKALEDARQKELDKDKPKPDASFTEKLTAQIINNLQVHIANVHLRYEDDITTGKAFSFGVTLHDLSIYTTDENWVESFLTEQVTRVFKIANLDSLSAYMNCRARLISQLPFDQLNSILREEIPYKDHAVANYTFILGPISSIARLKLNMTPEYDEPPFQLPKVDLGLEMDLLHIGMTTIQFHGLLKLADNMNRLQLGAPYRKYRPYNLPYKGHSAEWWRFAITCILEEQIRKKRKSWTWDHIKDHRDTCRLYIEKFKEKELAKKPPANLIETCNLLEKKIDIFNLILLRQRIQTELEEIKKTEQARVSKAGWFGGWFGGGSNNDMNEESGNIAKKLQAAMTDEEKAKLYKAIGYTENSAPLDVPEEYEAILMNFKLVAFEIGLYDDTVTCRGGAEETVDYTETVLLLRLSMATCHLIQRPAASALSITAGVSEMCLTGLKVDDLTPKIMCSAITDESNLLDFFFETNPLDKKCDQRIKIQARPLQIVYDSETFNRLIKQFTPPKSVNLSELEGAAAIRIAGLKERSATGMQYAIESHSIIDVDIQFMPNIVILPYKGRYIPGKQSAIIVSLGRFTITSKPHEKTDDVRALFAAGISQDEILGKMLSQAYDNFMVSIEDVQVLVTKAHEPWEAILISGIESELYALRPTSLKVEARVCVVDDDPRLPKSKIDIILPSIILHVTEDRFFEALDIVTSIPTPGGDPEEPSLLRTVSSASFASVATYFTQEAKKKPAKKLQQPDPFAKETVQYTDLEMNFSLKEIVISLHRDLPPIKSPTVVQFASDVISEQPSISTEVTSPADSNQFGTPVEELPQGNEDFQDAGENALSLIKGAESLLDKQKILELKIEHIEANMAHRTYEMVASAKLGAISLTQYSLGDHSTSGTLVTIIDTPHFTQELKYLLTVEYLRAEKSCPEFITKYNSTEQSATVNFSTLNIILHLEYVKYLMEIANKLQLRLEEVTSTYPPRDRVGSAGRPALLDQLATITEEAENEDPELAGAGDSIYNIKKPQCDKKRQHRKIVDSIKFNIVANLEQVSLKLTCLKRDISLMKVQHFYAGAQVKTSYTELTLQLKDIIVNDLNPINIHKSILSIVGNDALNCQVVLFNLNETRDYNSNDFQVNVEIGCMKIVFLNWFVTSVLSFLNNFQAAQIALAEASANAAGVAKQNALAAYEKATRMKLNVKVKAPIIVVPMHSQSLDAIALDLGYLMCTNTFNEVEVNHECSPAVLDDIKMELRDLKLSKVSIIDRGSKEGISVIGSIDTIDLAYGLKSDTNILDPMSFILNVKRNLSSQWYHDVPEIDLSGRLKSVELNLFMEDYALIMTILNRNLSEGVDEFPKDEEKATRPTTPTTPTTPTRKKSVTPAPDKQTRLSVMRKTLQTSSNEKVYEQMKFNFVFDGVVANLKTSANEGLARFGIYFLSVKGKQLVNGIFSVSTVLCNMQIDDMRPHTKSKITQYLGRKDWNENVQDTIKQILDKNDPQSILEACRMERKYMVDVTAILKATDTFAEAHVCGFDLIISIDFLLQLSHFFTLPEDTETLEIPGSKGTEPKTSHKTTAIADAAAAGKRQTSVGSAGSSKEPQKQMNLLLYVEEPDIILVENLEDVNCNAIIFNAKVRLNHRVVDNKEIISGEIDALKMYMCSFMPERREATRHYIIHPCVISLQGSTPENQGLHISLNLSDIIINISPATIELFNKAILSLSAGSVQKALERRKEADYTDIWKASKFKDKHFWFLKADVAEDALALINRETLIAKEIITSKTEKCVVEVPSITLVIESGVGYYTKPLLSLDTRLDAVVSNWSTNLSVNGSLSTYMNYYNQALATWEPIIEMNERLNRNGEKEYLPWELNFNLSIEEKQSESHPDVEETTTKIKIQSDENLEITMSKTCLDLVNELSAAFSQAIDAKGLVKPEVIAPFILENDTGFDIHVNFRHGIFTLHEAHMPNATTTNTVNRSIIFQANDVDTNLAPDQIKDCQISAGGRVYLQTKDLSTITSEDEEEYNIYVTIVGINKEVVLPVSKNDRRYFPLYRDTNADPWGIVSEVRSEYGTSVVNIHGIVNVHNHFSRNITIYRAKSLSGDKIVVGTVEPGAVFHVPLHAIYADPKSLFFSLDGYHVSVQGINWSDAPTDLTYQRQLQCDPKETYEALYINVVREKTEIYFEHTDKFKLLSAFYTFHLRPPLYFRNALPIPVKVSVVGCTVRKDHSNVDNVEAVDGNNSLVARKEDMLDYGEKDVKPGDGLHMPTVKMIHKHTDQKSFLVVRLINYLEKNWSCTTQIPEDHESFAVWTFVSYDADEKMDMELSVNYVDHEGSLMLSIFSPFWMVNKTGLMLSYKTNFESIEVLYHPPEYDGPILFSLREKLFFNKKHTAIRVDSGTWSDKIPLDVAGSMGEVKCQANNRTYQIGVHNSLTQNTLTKQITFIPFYIISNKCEFEIEVQENSRPADPWMKLLPNASVPYWPVNDSDKLMVARVENKRTVAFDYTEVQCTLLQLNDNKYGGINVDIQVTEGGIYISFYEYNPGDAPGLLINHTSQSVTYVEKNHPTEYVLRPRQKILYAWRNPAGERILTFGLKREENDLRRDDCGEVILNNGAKAYWVTFLDGLQRVLLFTEVEAIIKKTETSSILQSVTQSLEVRIHGIGFSLYNNETGVDIMYLGITSSGIIWESKKHNKKRFKQMNIHDTAQIEAQYQAFLIDKSLKQTNNTYYLDERFQLNFENWTLKKDEHHLRQIRRTHLPGVWILMNSSPFQSQIHAKINKIQLDNQLLDCIFPVVLAPIAPPKSLANKTTLKPFVECSIVQRVVPHSTVNQFKYATLLIQEFHFKVDLLFLTAVVNLFASTVTEEQAAQQFKKNIEYIFSPLSEMVATQSQLDQKHFFDNLHLGPLKAHLSFSMAGADVSDLPGILPTLVQGIGVTLTDVNDVVLRLAFFEREYQFFTKTQLIGEITTHYTGQALKQLYVLVLGLDVLGNPYGLVVGVRKGIGDLFYEPFQGAIQGPGEFAEGLALGVKSLFSHTVGGAAGAVSKITGAMGKGLAALTFDEDYQRKRRIAQNRKAASFQEGIARSSKGLVMGFVDGVTGVVTKPVSGAMEEGVGGFFKGLGKGAVGLVTRPTAGMVDFASGTFGAVKRATEGHEEAKRIRPPRFQSQDNVLRPYCLEEATGNKLLKEIEKGKYAGTDAFLYYVEVVEKKEILLVSNHRIIYGHKNDLYGTWNVQWTYLWHEIQSAIPTDRGLVIKLKKENKKVLGIFSSSNESNSKVIYIADKSKRDKLAEIIESQRSSA